MRAKEDCSRKNRQTSSRECDIEFLGNVHSSLAVSESSSFHTICRMGLKKNEPRKTQH